MGSCCPKAQVCGQDPGEEALFLHVAVGEDRDLAHHEGLRSHGLIVSRWKAGRVSYQERDR